MMKMKPTPMNYAWSILKNAPIMQPMGGAQQPQQQPQPPATAQQLSRLEQPQQPKQVPPIPCPNCQGKGTI